MAGPMPKRAALLTLAGLVGTGLLLAHANVYRFLTDDAFISFRYARNLAQGHGLVFNPGGERVEGYTNFLWVLLLAAGDVAGIPPERAATVLSLVATVGLAAVVAAFAARASRDGRPLWVAAFPLLALAATRSVAVWSTGGLETRLFELLVVAGVFRIAIEVDPEGAPNRRAASGWLFGLAALTRPDGVLIAGSVLGTGFLLERGAGRADAGRRALARAIPFVGLVAAHLAWRLVYYGAWVPNTYLAKVGGRTWWEMGAAYLGAFTLEYAAWLWIPVAVWGVVAARGSARRTGGLVAAVVLPHALYVASIGGDHFEYRPLDLYFPFGFLLVAEGLETVRRGKGGRAAVPLAAAILAGLVWIPWRSHATFPEGPYLPRFPGGSRALASAAEDWLDPARDPLLRWPALRVLGRTHRDLLRTTTARMVGIRQEEHARFLASVIPGARTLRRLVEEGKIAPDLRLALASVGVVPYLSGLPTFDRLGLTDADAARAAPFGDVRAMAHERRDVFDLARAKGVALWSIQAGRVVFTLGDPSLVQSIADGGLSGRDLGFAEVEPGVFLVGVVPSGPAAVASRLPFSPWRSFGDAEAREGWLGRQIAALRARLSEAPRDPDLRLALAQALLLDGDPGAARAFEAALEVEPRRLQSWKGLAGARRIAGDREGAFAALDRGVAIAREIGEREIEADFLRLRR